MSENITMNFFIGLICFILRLKFSTTDDKLSKTFIIEHKFNVSSFQTDNESATLLTNKRPDELDNLCMSLKDAIIFSPYKKFDDFFENFVKIKNLEIPVNVTHGFDLISFPHLPEKNLFYCKFNDFIIHLLTFSSTDYYVVKINTKHTKEDVAGSSGITGAGLGLFTKPLEMQEANEHNPISVFYETFSKTCAVSACISLGTTITKCRTWTGIIQNKTFLQHNLQTLKLSASIFLKQFVYGIYRKMKIKVSQTEVTVDSSGEKGKPHINFRVTRTVRCIRCTLSCYANYGNKEKKISIPVLRYNIYNEYRQIAEFFIAKNPSNNAEIFVLIIDDDDYDNVRIHHYFVSEKPLIALST